MNTINRLLSGLCLVAAFAGEAHAVAVAFDADWGIAKAMPGSTPQLL